ncbi:MAG TPA: glycine cleavage T C-terminal barrel domain-containing protein [Baekduia sp.]|nr:glycine cleavage T C-terminal barrel domain-containing protein [Baekduia sp.]
MSEGPIAARQRQRYSDLVGKADRPFDVERAAVFSPAAPAQDPAAPKGLYFRWTPLHLVHEYTDWWHESQAHTQTCYIGDWTAISKIRVHGPDALTFLTQVGMNDLSQFESGQVKHHVQLDEDGRVAAEGVLYRAGDDDFVYTGGTGSWTTWRFGLGDWDAQIEDIAAEMYIFEIQGPTSLFVLEAATGEDLRDIAFNRSRMARVAERDVRVLRTGISGELGYELHGPADDAAAVWAAVAEAGAAHGIRQLGTRSQLVAHIEAGIATVGIDYLSSAIVTPGAPTMFPASYPLGSFIPTGIHDYFRYPGELGWGSRGSGRDHDFVGRDALLRLEGGGEPERRLVSLVWNADDVKSLLTSIYDDGPLPDQMEMPRVVGATFDRVVVTGEDVGVATSRTFSPTLGQTISLAVVEHEHAAPGTEVSVVWGRPGTPQRELRAVVSATPLKPDHRRTDVRELRSGAS